MDSRLQKENRKTVFTFYRRADQKYDSSVKQIFLILDNVSIHKSNKVKETLVDITGTYLVFPPTTRSPKLNRIEVRWLWMHRQAINNSTFLNEQRHTEGDVESATKRDRGVDQVEGLSGKLGKAV